MGRLTEYIKGSRAELKKVQWPTRRETRNSTLLVILISVLTAAFLGLLDFVLNLGLEKLLV